MNGGPGKAARAGRDTHLGPAHLDALAHVEPVEGNRYAVHVPAIGPHSPPVIVLVAADGTFGPDPRAVAAVVEAVTGPARGDA